jgi:glutamate-1-semialdehyde 2,1-aminomutase
VAISVDGVGSLNDYIRFPSQWETVERVARQYAELESQQENFSFGSICTVSAYNLHAIPEVMNWWNGIATNSNRGPQSSVTLNFVRDPAYMAADVLPAALKMKACESLRNHFPKLADRVHSFVSARDGSNLLDRLWHRTRELDRIRGQSVADSIPQLRSLFLEGADSDSVD